MTSDEKFNEEANTAISDCLNRFEPRAFAEELQVAFPEDSRRLLRAVYFEGRRMGLADAQNLYSHRYESEPLVSRDLVRGLDNIEKVVDKL